MKNDSEFILQAIDKYKMTEQETAVYKMALIYEHLVKKMFPDMRHDRMKTSGDPRQKASFKYCWKVIQDHGHELPVSEHKLYILAQLKAWKHIINSGGQVLVAANCLAGDNAWRRWRGFKYRYEQRKQFQTIIEAGITVNASEKVVKAITSDKTFFQKRFNRLECEDIINSLDDRSLLRWVNMQHISGYYPHLSPLVKNWLEEKKITVSEYFGSGVNIYKDGVTSNIEQYFQSEFPHEFRRTILPQL